MRRATGFRARTALASFLVATLGWAFASPGTAGAEVDKVTSLPDLLAGCGENELASETFEGLIDGAIIPEDFDFPIGYPATLFRLDSGVTLSAPDPNSSNASETAFGVADLKRGGINFALGTNGAIYNRSECVGGSDAGMICSEASDCDSNVCDFDTGLPSGTAFGYRDTSTAECIGFFLPESASECKAVGLYLSAFDGAAVTLSVFDQSGNLLGSVSNPTLPVQNELDNFLGVIVTGESAIRSFQLQSSERFAFDDIWHPLKMDDSEISEVATPLICPEPSAGILGLAALAVLAAFARKSR